ncbi:MAG TPA: Gfo/Idh/MocA family oxidoreductase [Thermoanaerobaculia bacterium]|nr:Gfo/Idh/MocA family oxidoreductase [Thermoanaerobaculia bacterium]
MSAPRLGFVGLGWIGAMRMNAVAEAGTGEVAALCESVPERLDQAAEAHPRAARFADLDAMLDQSEKLGLDGIVIATPNALHEAQTVAALERGLAVFCQKPLALNASEAREMVRMAEKADCLLGVDYSYRFTNGAQGLKRMIEAGELGRIFNVELVFHNAYGPDKPWCWDPRLAGGGALMDLGVHLIDLAFWLLDDPPVRRVRGAVFRQGERLTTQSEEVDDFASAWLDLKDGDLLASLAVSWNAHAGTDCVIRATVLGTGGGAELRNTGGSFFDFELARFDGRKTSIVANDSRDGLGRAILDWVCRLAASNRYDPEIERSVTVSEVVDAVYGRD